MTSYEIYADKIYNSRLEELPQPLIVNAKTGKIEGYGKRGYATERIFKGYILPAFIDSHLHITWIGLKAKGADLSKTSSSKEIAKQLARVEIPLAYGRGWNEELLKDPENLTRNLLDRVIPNKPAIAVRVCGHKAVANTLAILESRVLERYPSLVDKEHGIIWEDAVEYMVEALIEKHDISEIVLEAVKRIASNGIGGVASMACPLAEARALKELEMKGMLTLRVACYPKPEHLKEMLYILRYSRTVRVSGIKLFADGSLGAKTAYLRTPYHDDPSNRGLLLLDKNKIIKYLKLSLKMKLKTATHAIGNAALDEVIEAYRELQPGENARIEHASITSDKQIKEIASLAVHTVIQPHFRVSDYWVTKILSQDDAFNLYRFKSLLNNGVKIALSTDAPVEPIDPRETILAAQSKCKSPLCRKEEALTLREAIYAYTREAAQAAGEPVKDLGDIELQREAKLLLVENSCDALDDCFEFERSFTLL